MDIKTVVYYLKGTHPAIKEHLQSARPKSIFIPEIVVAELLYGVARSQQKPQNTAKVEAFLKPFTRIAKTVGAPFTDSLRFASAYNILPEAPLPCRTERLSPIRYKRNRHNSEAASERSRAIR